MSYSAFSGHFTPLWDAEISSSLRPVEPVATPAGVPVNTAAELTTGHMLGNLEKNRSVQKCFKNVKADVSPIYNFQIFRCFQVFYLFAGGLLQKHTKTPRGPVGL